MREIRLEQTKFLLELATKNQENQELIEDIQKYTKLENPNAWFYKFDPEMMEIPLAKLKPEPIGAADEKLNKLFRENNLRE